MKNKSLTYAIKLSVVALLSFSLVACDDKEEEDNDDVTTTLSKNGTVETAISVKHINDSVDELITHHNVWVKDSLYKVIEKRDTLPSLGVEVKTIENNEGDNKQVAGKKAYEIFITVK